MQGGPEELLPLANSQILVKDIMSSPVVTAFENASIKEIAQKMRAKDVDTVIIVNKSGEPVGIITEGDIVRRLLSKKRNLWFTHAKDIMSSPVITAYEEEDLENIARKMARERIKRICVVNKENRLVGIVTQTDLLENTSYLLDLMEELIKAGYGEEAIGKP